MSVANELDKFGKYVKQQAKSNLSKRKKKDTSALYDGINYKIDSNDNTTTLSFTFGNAQDYWEFVDKGVKGVSSSAKLEKKTNEPLTIDKGICFIISEYCLVPLYFIIS